MGTLARNRLIEKRTFLCRLSINHCNILIIYLSIYFTTKKKSTLDTHFVYPLSF